MEPLAVTAGIVNLIGYAEKLRGLFHDGSQASELSDEEALVFRVHLGILEEISRVTLTSARELPPTTQSCAQLCQRRLENLQKVINHDITKTKPSTKELIKIQNSLKQPIADFATSVQLYRDVVMDSITHSLLSEQRKLQGLMEERVQMQMQDQIQEQRHMQRHMQTTIDGQIREQQHLHNDYITQVTHLKQFAAQGFVQNSEWARAELDSLLSKMQSSESKLKESERRGTDTSRLAEKLREVAANHQKSERALGEESKMSSSLAVSQRATYSERDRFTFSATIVGHHRGKIEHIVARAKMDTGCEDNWISKAILERGELIGSLEPVKSKETFLGFGGAAFEPLGTMEITWFGVNTSKSWKNQFLVHRDGPFDMVLGSRWITEDSLLTLGQPALALRMTDFTKEELLLIEKNAKTKGATADQLSSLRRAEEAAARDRKRRAKAASLAAKPTDMTTVHSSSLLTAQSPDAGSSRQLSRLSTPSRISTVDTESGSE